MKNLELKLQKRLLIVEAPQGELTATGNDDEVYYAIKRDDTYIKIVDGKKWKFICRGSDLTEEIAKGFVMKKQVYMTPEIFFFKDYKTGFGSCMNALQSFISAVENAGYYWGKNPIEKPDDVSGLGSPFDNLITKEIDKWFMADVLTLNPYKTLIFEILE